MSGSLCLSTVCLEAQPEATSCSSPQASSLLRLRRERTRVAWGGEASSQPHRLSAPAAPVPRGGLSQEELDALCQDASEVDVPVQGAEEAGGIPQALLDAMAIAAEADDEEALDDQLACRRRSMASVSTASSKAPLSQEELDLLCVDADDADDEEEASFHHRLRRARAYAGAAVVATLQQALSEALLEADEDEESEDSLQRSLRRARAYGGAACAEALRARLASEAPTEGCSTPRSCGSESPCALLRVRRARAFEGPRRAAELVAELVARAELTPEPAETALTEPPEPAADLMELSAQSPAKTAAASPGSPVEMRILKAASPNRRRGLSKEGIA